MKELWVPISGAIAQQRKVETIANNIANANTPGFKKDQLVFKEYLAALDKGPQDIDLPNKEFKPKDFYRSYGAENSFVTVDGSYPEFSQGQLVPTGNPLDLGVHGKGFFEVSTPQGIRFTRKGSFSISNKGTLVTEQGYPVLSKLDPSSFKSNNENTPGPSKRTIQIPRGNISINMQGELFVNGGKVSDLSTVEFKDTSKLQREGSSLFISRDNTNIKQSQNTAIRQGFIEQSNVNAIHEMAELIKANRQFESLQRVIKTYDQMAGKGVNEIAKF